VASGQGNDFKSASEGEPEEADLKKAKSDNLINSETGQFN